MQLSEKMRKGFTLVELSIVLVIIGLLIGGILVARSMIDTARVQNAVKAIQQFDVAYSNFKTMYNQMPGDSNLFSPVGTNDGNLMDDRGCCGGRIAQNGLSEQCNFWKHLQQGGFSYQGKTFTTTFSTFDIDSSTPNAPMVKLDKDAGILPTGYGIGANGQCSTSSLCYAFGYWRGVTDFHIYTYQNNPPPIATRATALSIDAKIDDSISSSGIVQSYTCLNYNSSSSAIDCNLYVQMLSQVGQR